MNFIIVSSRAAGLISGNASGNVKIISTKKLRIGLSAANIKHCITSLYFLQSGVVPPHNSSIETFNSLAITAAFSSVGNLFLFSYADMVVGVTLTRAANSFWFIPIVSRAFLICRRIFQF